MRDAAATVARHPDALTIHAAVQVAAAALMLTVTREGGRWTAERIERSPV